MLARLRKSMKDKDAGFTLIELLVVLVIIGVLAAIAVPMYLNQRKKGVDSTMRADINSMSLAQETYTTKFPLLPGLAFPGTGTAAADALGFKASPGNVVVVTTTPSVGYCVTVTNIGSTTPAGTMYFDSALGGLAADGGWTKPTGGACV